MITFISQKNKKNLRNKISVCDFKRYTENIAKKIHKEIPLTLIGLNIIDWKIVPWVMTEIEDLYCISIS